ncbi:MAG: Smr/MutS family protein [Crocinitomicaceae bacterium]
MQFQVGEKVVFLNEAGGGRITKIVGNLIYVEDETGFDRPFKAADLGKVHSTNYSVENKDKIVKDVVPAIEKKRAYTIFKDYWEVDLHLEFLVAIYGANLIKQPDQALLKQMPFLKMFCSKLKQKVRKLIVIHGFGKGMLRQELQDYLRGQDGIDFFDAPYVEYGHGAIQVEIKYKY